MRFSKNHKMACKQFLYMMSSTELKHCKVHRGVTAMYCSQKVRMCSSNVKEGIPPEGSTLQNGIDNSEGRSSPLQPQLNPINIQMLSKPLHEQIFKDCIEEDEAKLAKRIKRSIKHLEKHNLWGKQSSVIPEIDFKLPELYGNNIDEHFRFLAKQQSEEYLKLAEKLAQAELPEMPTEWVYQKGWTKYNSDGIASSVDFPDEQALVFDVEVCLSEGNFPTLAVAASPNTWYSWCSEKLIEDTFSWAQKPSMKDLIPLETAANSYKPADGQWLSRVVIGHNVSYDRAYIKEQYLMKGPKTRFLDTMSLHMAISGLTSFQRILWTYHRNNKNQGNQEVKDHLKKSKQRISGPPMNDWINVSSPNNLRDVHSLYCGGPQLDKSERDVFVSGTKQDVQEKFQELMSYCARDVSATHRIFSQILPLFFERFPHPVTFAAMLEMGQAYLPVNDNWERYLREAQGTYEDLQKEMKLSLMHIANDACHLLHNDRYKEDPWLWELDWNAENLKIKKSKKASNSKKKSKSSNGNSSNKVQGGTREEVVTEHSDSNQFVSSEITHPIDSSCIQEGMNTRRKDENTKSKPLVEEWTADSVQDTNTAVDNENPFAAAGINHSIDGTQFDIPKRSYSHYVSLSPIDRWTEILNSPTQNHNFIVASLQRQLYSQDVAFTNTPYKSYKTVVVKKTKKKKKKKKEKKQVVEKEKEEEEEEEEETEDDRINRILSTSELMYKNRQHMAGYPNWYRELCPRFHKNTEWTPGPTQISSQTRVTPKLLQLTWDDYPLHYDAKHGWGYLVPGRTTNLLKKKVTPMCISDYELYNDSAQEVNIIEDFEGKQSTSFPHKVMRKLLKAIRKSKNQQDIPTEDNVDSKGEELDLTEEEIFMEIEKLGSKNGNGDNEKMQKMTKKLRLLEKERQNHQVDSPSWHVGNGPHNDVDIPGCWFFRMPHKDGAQKKVGNPLAKDFLAKMEDGTLSSYGGSQANRILEINKMISFWRNAQDRVSSQLVVWLEKNELPRTVTRHLDYEEEGSYGAILPKIVTAGTVTRRAVEPTWLTASNARADRVGSELKAMVQVPPGYHFVGADVDSQELWIASLLGDAKFAGFHGCTAFGWMTLQGNKSERTDLHSKTADTINISRDQAKIFNYGRIYGAGQAFAIRLLTQFNHRMSQDEARSKAATMYQATKGVKMYKLRDDVRQLVKKVFNTKKQAKWVSLTDLKRIRRELRTMMDYSTADTDSYISLVDLIDANTIDLTQTKEWKGGSESEMFNKLENIAMSDEPRTPVLECRISRALEPQSVNSEFLTSRINWVVQSSAVDYLHLMLVSMRWLLDKYDIDGRFSISIHDEVRYLVNSEDKHRAALALQISNLLTRCMFAYKVGMKDLPQSVAFFSSVDIDTVLRKESHMDCKSPSNPHGLHRGYGIPTGDALDIYQVLDLTNNGSLEKPKNSSKKSQKTSVT
ncbi:DNA polymerase subunit gamma-1-like [Glandiceps talaboti]